MSTLSSLSSLAAHERRLLIKAFLIVVVTRIAVTALSLHQLRLFLAWLAERAAAPQAHDDYAHRVALAVTRASALVPGADSVTRAFATITLLRCRGLVGSLRLVVRHHHGDRRRLEARVTYKGRVLVGDPTPAGDHACPGDLVWLLGPPAALPAFDGEYH